MSRDIHPDVLASLEEDNLQYVMLVKMRFNEGGANTYLRLNSSAISVYWDEGSGDEEYQGVGNLGRIETAEEGLAVQSYSIRLTLSGIDPSYIVKAAEVQYKNQPIIIYLANLNVDNTVKGDPLVFFAGRMDTMDIQVGREASISVTANSRLSDWERPRGGRYNHYTQKAYYAFLHNYGTTGAYNSTKVPLDEGFVYVDQIQGKEVVWGRGEGGGGDDIRSNPGSESER
jgi:hypothetical protein